MMAGLLNASGDLVAVGSTVYELNLAMACQGLEPDIRFLKVLNEMLQPEF